MRKVGKGKNELEIEEKKRRKGIMRRRIREERYTKRQKLNVEKNSKRGQRSAGKYKNYKKQEGRRHERQKGKG